MDLNFEAAIVNVCLLCILTVPHEFAHAWAASKLGDDTPEQEGRLTLYPPAHIDIIGTVILPAIISLMGAGFIGWGKPVNTTPSKLRFGLNGLAMVAMAGPASNIVLAVIFAAVYAFTRSVQGDISDFAARAATLSVYLALFNMIPIPPLDGSKLLLAARFPVVVYQELGRFGFLLLILLLSITPIGGYLSYYSFRLSNAIFSLFP